MLTDSTLFAGDQTPAHLDGFGPIPAFLARGLVREADRAWVRRMFTRPDTGDLVAMESRRREFTGALRQFLVLRDQTCRNSWCDAPIRHADHVIRFADGGETSADNGQGLCEACNYAKELADWHARRLPGNRHPVETTTPTGHQHVSRAPDPPGTRPTYRLEFWFANAA